MVVMVNAWVKHGHILIRPSVSNQWKKHIIMDNDYNINNAHMYLFLRSNNEGCFVIASVSRSDISNTTVTIDTFAAEWRLLGKGYCAIEWWWLTYTWACYAYAKVGFGDMVRYISGISDHGNHLFTAWQRPHILAGRVIGWFLIINFMSSMIHATWKSCTDPILPLQWGGGECECLFSLSGWCRTSILENSLIPALLTSLLDV